MRRGNKSDTGVEMRRLRSNGRKSKKLALIRAQFVPHLANNCQLNKVAWVFCSGEFIFSSVIPVYQVLLFG